MRAVFHILLMGTLLAVVFLLPAAAQEEGGLEEEFTFLEEEDVVFASAKHQQDISESPSAISVITREQIENTYCTDLVCLLRQVPEVEVLNILPGMSLAGGRALTDDFEHGALLLVNGREVNFEAFGIVVWQSLPVHLADIDRIEVIRGPGSALYGANAQKMVVSIFTRRSTENTAEVFLGSGEHDRSSLHLRLSQPLGSWQLHLAGGMDTEGHWQRRGLRQRELARLNLFAERETEASATSLQLGMLIPQGTIFTALAPFQVEDTFMGYLFVSHRTDLVKVQLTADLWDAGMLPDLHLFYGETKLGDFPERIRLFVSNLDGEAQVTWSPFADNLLVAGGNYRWGAFVSHNVVQEVTHQHRVGFFLQDEQRLFGRLLITAGVRLDYNNITPFALSPRLACVWRLAGEQVLRLAFGQAFRKPSYYETSTHFKGVEGTAAFPELERFFRENIGNDDLGNEKSTTLEAGYRLRLADLHLTFETNAFYSMFRNLISFKLDMVYENGLPDLNQSRVAFLNAGREVDSAGGSLAVVWQPVPVLRLAANYTFRHSWYIKAPPASPVSGEGGQGDRVPWERAHLMNASLTYLPEQGLRLGLSMHAHSATDRAWPRQGGIFNPKLMVHAPASVMLGGFAALRFGDEQRWIELGARAFNLLNAGFRDLQSVTRPDGVELGGELLGRLIFLFLQGAL